MSVDQLLCSVCSDIHIELGLIPVREVEVKTKSGGTIRITEPASVVSIPTCLLPVVEKLSDGRCRLGCGHIRMGMPLVSAQEQLTLADGTVVHGKLPL
jgi:hypothetical protein